MPPRYSYWTIIAGGLPTAFRAAEREDLLPTFSQIRHKHPDAQLKWFARGKLWDSPESARRDTEERRRARPSPDSGAQGARGRDWRPGGEHRDPRQKYKDAKKERNVRDRKRKFERRQRVGEGRVFPKKPFARSQGPDERPRPPRPDPPGREPRPREGTEPTPPPRPAEPAIPAPGPPERGRFNKNGRFKSGPFNKSGGRFNKGGRFDKGGRFNKKGPPRR